jgi:hypothetical protein
MPSRRTGRKPPRRTDARVTPKSANVGTRTESADRSHDHEHPAGTDMVPVTIRASVRLPEEVSGKEQIALYLFDEDERPLCHCVLEKDARVEVPRRLIGHMITAVAAPVAAGRKEPTLDRLRARGATIVRVPLDARRAIELGELVIDWHLFKRSCCRVRGRVIRRIQLPSGQIITRPLCNARVVICEVDISPRRIIYRLPDDLIRRLAVDAADILPPRPDPPPFADRVLMAEPVHVHTTAGGRAHAGHPHIATAATALLPARQFVDDAANIRDHLVANIAILNKYWCRFAGLFHTYDVDCVKTAPIGGDGRFDTDISYFCYGDRPDLYFKVEQRCGDTWTVVHAPSVACHTHWDYCCGDEVEIVVTSETAGLGPAFSPCVPSSATDPAAIGQWQMLPYTSQVFVVHAALMRTGKVLMFSGGVENQLPKESRTWDPGTGSFASHTFADDLFCAFQVVLGDGRVLVMGGSKYTGPHGQGVTISYTFDPGAPGWVKHPDMAFGRWYPTAVVLDDGRVIVSSGRAAGTVIAEVERFNPSANTWTTLPASANKALDIYPSLHLMAGGKVLYTGTRWEGGSSSPRPWPSPPDSALFDPATNSWTNVAKHVIPNRTEGTSVLLPPRASAAHHHGHGEAMPPPGTLSRVLVLGGDCGSPAERVSAEIIDMADPQPKWTRIADMHHRRVNPNAVLLPDGHVLVCAGITGFKWDPDPGRVLESEIFDPQSLTWRRAAVMNDGRQYHSVSLLLPDGRVLNTGSVGGQGGGANLTSMEIYSPPYLFRGPRPRITAYQTSVARGDMLVVTTPDACRIRRAVFIRPGAPTHHTDSEPRYLPLDFEREGSCDLHVHVPEGPGLLPPGYYLLFVLDDCDVPSVGKFIRVE